MIAGGLDQPGFCFVRASLYGAARRFKFFPTFGEVAAYLDEIAEPARRMRARLAVLASAPPSLIKGGIMEESGKALAPGERITFVRDLPPAEREKFLRQMTELRRRLAQDGVGDSAAAVAARRRADEINERMRQRLSLAPAETQGPIQGPPGLSPGPEKA